MPLGLRKEFTALRLLLLLMLLAGCTTTITRIKNPVFAGSTDSLALNLHRFVSCQHINLDGKDVTVNGKDSTVLEIDIINGTGIPEDLDQMNVLADSIATTIKHALRDQGQYANYAVFFIKQVETSVMRKRTWRSKEFSAAEL